MIVDLNRITIAPAVRDVWLGVVFRAAPLLVGQNVPDEYAVVLPGGRLRIACDVALYGAPATVISPAMPPAWWRYNLDEN